MSAFRLDIDGVVPWRKVVAGIGAAALLLLGVRLALVVFEFGTQVFFYDGSWLGKQLIGYGFRRQVYWVGALCLAAGCSYRFDNPVAHLDRPSKWLYWALLAAQTYAVALMDYNHYFDQWFAVDRLLLVALALLVARYPLWLPLYLIELVLLSGQLAFPEYIGYDHTHKSVTLPLLSAFWVLCLLRPVLRERIRYLYVVAVLGLAGAWYVQAGLSKWALNWLTDNNLYHLIAGAHAFGYDGGWGGAWLPVVAHFVDRYHYPLQAFTLVVELLFPFICLPGRRFTPFVLLTYIGFHLGIYFLSGIFFWQWILLESVVVYFAWRHRRAWRGLAGATLTAAYFALLLGWPLAVHVAGLAWLDCGFVNGYFFALQAPDGRTRSLDSSFFSPYDVGFAKNRFTFAGKAPALTNTMGQCFDGELAKLIQGWEDNPDARKALESRREKTGMQRYDSLQTAQFYVFLQQFTQNKLAYDPVWISKIDPPLHMRQGPNQQNYSAEADSLRVIYRELILRSELQAVPYQTQSVALPLE